MKILLLILLLSISLFADWVRLKEVQDSRKHEVGYKKTSINKYADCPGYNPSGVLNKYKYVNEEKSGYCSDGVAYYVLETVSNGTCNGIPYYDTTLTDSSKCCTGGTKPYRDGPGGVVECRCPIGMDLINGVCSCPACPAGKEPIGQCPPPFYSDDNACPACVDKCSNGGSHKCVNVEDNSDYWSTYTEGGHGTGSYVWACVLPDANTTKKCPAGSVLSNNTGECISCPDGEYPTTDNQCGSPCSAEHPYSYELANAVCTSYIQIVAGSDSAKTCYSCDIGSTPPRDNSGGDSSGGAGGDNSGGDNSGGTGGDNSGGGTDTSGIERKLDDIKKSIDTATKGDSKGDYFKDTKALLNGLGDSYDNTIQNFNNLRNTLLKGFKTTGITSGSCHSITATLWSRTVELDLSGVSVIAPAVSFFTNISMLLLSIYVIMWGLRNG
jgi:hypothetical protein